MKEWRPHKRQEAFLQLPDTIFEALYGGAAGGGKSEALLLLPIARKFYENPRFKGIIFRRTFPELEAEVILRSREWYPSTGAVYTQDKKRWTFPSGATMNFGHVENVDDKHKYDSAEYNYMGFDELTSFTEEIYVYLTLTRCRTSDSSLPSIVRSGTNPGNIGHAWVKKRFIDVVPPNVVQKDKRTGMMRIFIPSRVEDNPHIDPVYKNRLAALPEHERRAKLEGEWDSFEGQVFGDWRTEHLPGEPDNAVHVVAPFHVPEWWPRILAVDWGFAAMMVALWGAISPDGRLYIYREYTVVRTKISEWGTEIRNISQSETIKRVILCKSAWQDRGEETTIQQQFQKFTGLIPEAADNQRISGKIAIQEFLRWNPKPVITNAIPFNYDYSIDVLKNKGMEQYTDYLKSYDTKPQEHNLPKLQIFSTCLQVIKTIPICVYEKKSNSTGKSSEDVKEFDGDDAYDTLRYLIKAAEPMMDSSSSEGEYRTKVQNAHDLIKPGQDQTSFYRKMEFIEREGQNKIKPVRRLISMRAGR